MKISSYAQSSGTFTTSGAVHLRSDCGAFVECRVLSIKPHKNVFLLSLEGLSTLEKAEQYRGADIYISKDRPSREAEGEYFWYELIGMKVVSSTGKLIGTINHVFRTGSNDIYVVGEGKEEILIPATHEVVKEVDVRNQRMIIEEMEGLLDLNAG